MTDRKQALIDLRDEIKVGSWPGSDFYSCFSDSQTLLAYSAYQGSLDAAKKLHEEVLPNGEGWEIYRTGKYPGMIPGSSPFKYAASVGYGGKSIGKDDNPARAWLLAILEALIAQEDQSDDG